MVFAELVSPYPLNREAFGQAGWAVLHSMAAVYPDNPDKTKRKEMRNFIKSFVGNMPCQECKQHGMEYITLHKPNVRSRKALVNYLCRWHNDVNERTGKKKIRCSTLHKDSEICEECKIKPVRTTLADSFAVSSTAGGKALEGHFEDMKAKSVQIITDLCIEAGVPMPRIEFKTCQIGEHEGNSCTHFDTEHPEDGVMYLDPYKFSPRTLVHETKHWIELNKGNIEEAEDEDQTDEFARGVIDKYFGSDYNIDDIMNKKSTQVTLADTYTLKDDDKSGFMKGIDSVYEPVANLFPHFSDASTLNDIHTPEILAYGGNVLSEMFLTPFGQSLFNLATGVGFIVASGFASDLSKRDRHFLMEWGSHQFWSIIKFANPTSQTAAIQGAQQAGSSLARMDFMGAVNAVVKNPTSSYIGAPPAQAKRAYIDQESGNVVIQRSRAAASSIPPKPKADFLIKV